MRKTSAGLPAVRAVVWAVCCTAGWAQPAWAQTSIDAALDLKPAEETAQQPATGRSLRLFGELTAGRLSQRYGLPDETARRASIDLTWTFKPAPQWRGVISNRLDDVHPVEDGSRSTLNSLREASIGWQAEGGGLAFDLGRVNLRYGPAYGFNPTDYFRDGASRAVTTADPLALRENRLGTVMLRGQQLWDGGSVSLVLAPKLRDGPSRESFSLDLGATNHADRALVALGTRAGDRISLQGFAFHERHKGLQLGANATALLSDATVGFFEWSGGRDTELLSTVFGPSPRVVSRHRAVLGLTYTTPSRLALTVEAQYNGFALNKSQWLQAVDSVGVEALGAYLYEVQRRQDIASRRALMVYVSQRDAFIKNLELTGLVRVNVDDRSRFAWAEARYHFPRIDLALQWQANLGRSTSEYGAVPGKRLVQLLAAFYF
jgi:hypothetical protein